MKELAGLAPEEIDTLTKAGRQRGSERSCGPTAGCRKNHAQGLRRIGIRGLFLLCAGCSASANLDTYLGAEQTPAQPQAHHADDYPAIKWEGSGVISPGDLSAALKAKHVATLEVRDKLSGGKYRYVDQFTEAHKDVVLIHRVFQYRDHDKSWLLRAKNPDGKRYENYVLVTTSPYGGDGCHHIIYKRGQTLEEVYRLVFTKPDAVPEKARQAAVPESNKCQ